MSNEHALPGDRKMMGIEVPARAVHPRDVCRDHAVLNHLLAGRPRFRLRRDEHPDLLLPRARRPPSTCTKRCRRAHARGVLRPVACTATCRTRCRNTGSKIKNARRSRHEREPSGPLLDFIDDFTQRFPSWSTSTKPVDGQPHLEAAYRRHRRVSPERAMQMA